MSDTDSESDFDTGISIVCDNGSFTLKAGLASASADAPKSVFPSVIARKHIEITSAESNMVKRNACVGQHALAKRADDCFKLLRPINGSQITNFTDMEDIWHHMFYNELQVEPEQANILLTEPPLNPRAKKEKMKQIMFETFGVQAFYSTSASVLSLYASGRTTGVVVDSGGATTDAVPVYEGYLLPHAVLQCDVAGEHITDYLMVLLNEKHCPQKEKKLFSIGRDTARDIKEKHGLIHMDYEYGKQSKVLVRLPDGKQIELGHELVQCTEALFQPGLINKEDSDGLAKVLCDSIGKCDVDIRDELMKNIVVCGGSTLFPGFEERLYEGMGNQMRIGKHFLSGYIRQHFQDKILHQDLAEVVSKYVALKPEITAPSNRAYSAWIGGCILASLSTFQEMWITRDEYDEGPRIVHRRW